MWYHVKDMLPARGQQVLACYKQNDTGYKHYIRAVYVREKTIESSCEDEVGVSEYDEASDTYYLMEGWYEKIDNWGEYYQVAVCEGEVICWCPIKGVPKVFDKYFSPW
jgi:hypothetical protein